MLAKTISAAVTGIDAHPVEIEVKTTGSAPSSPGDCGNIAIVGLPDTAVKESRDRVKSAITSNGFAPPRGFTVINLAPADLKKEGAAFDLGIALGMLAAAGALDADKLSGYAVAGELALDGTVRPVKGALPIADTLADSGAVRYGLIVPAANAKEAALAAGGRMPVFPVHTLADTVNAINADALIQETVEPEDTAAIKSGEIPDFAEVKGQTAAKRAAEIAAAGGHNLIMCGPPGTGKSMIAMRLAGILPPMNLKETLETSRIHSVLGMLSDGKPLLNHRPFRAPHHTISDIGLIGGGREPRPGEISLAHNGVLFLDELPEFKRNVLEVLRQPLENGRITVSRASGSCTFPARFILCAAMNPCPCGRGEYELGCTCKPDEKRRYRRKISGPLLDRIDLYAQVPQLSQEELLAAPKGESSADIRTRVCKAREIQNRRFADTGKYCNAQMTPSDIEKNCVLSGRSKLLLRGAIERFKLSPRAYDRILKVARTIADLAGAEQIAENHIFEAISFRRNEFIPEN